jgi:predicted nucleotidyltransferase
MEMRLGPDFVEFLNLLNEHRVRYLLIGGYAVAVHGHVRATNDIDVWIEATPENARRTEAAIREFGFDLPELTTERLLDARVITRMGVPPMRIEVLSAISGVSFEEAYVNRISVDVDSIRVPVIGLEDLLANKRASGRAKDLADVEELST